MLRLFGQYYPIRNIFFVIGEGVFIYGSVLAGALIVIGPSALYQDTWFYAKLFLITGVCQTCLYYNELYDLNITAGAKELSTRLLQSFGFASVLLGFIYIAFPETIIGSLVFMIGVGIVDEGVKDVRRLVVKMEERIPPIEDLIENIQDQIHQTTSATEQQLQELMNVAHEWLSAYERVMGHGKAAKTKKK